MEFATATMAVRTSIDWLVPLLVLAAAALDHCNHEDWGMGALFLAMFLCLIYGVCFGLPHGAP